MAVKREKILAYALQNAVEHEGKAIVGSVLPKLFQEGLKKEEIGKVMPEIIKVVSEVNSMNAEKQRQEWEKHEKSVKKHEHKEREGLPELENAIKGKIVLRHAPFPSGAIHLGNAIPLIINDEYRKMYDGKVIFVIDDTIGSEEKQISEEAYKMLPEDMNALDIKWSGPIIYRSDRLEIYYKYAIELIKKGKAYVCHCDAKRLRENRAKGKECKCRSQTIEQNIGGWNFMMSKKAKEGSAVLRIKTSMQDENPAFRDRVLFRISDRKHPRTGSSYRVWPMLEMTAAVDDHLLGMTHIIRGNQLRIESEMEQFIWDIFGWKHPTLAYTPRIVIYSGDTNILSKSKSQAEVESGKYIGWDDPRTWSVRSLLKRGIQKEALRSFVSKFGMSDKESMEVPIDMLYNENKKLIEDSDRYFFIENPVKIKIQGAPEMKVKVPLHPAIPKKGNRNFETAGEFCITKRDFDDIKKSKEGAVYRLMHIFNFTRKGSKFLYHSTEHSDELGAKLIHWLPASEGEQIKIMMDDGKYAKGVVEQATKQLEPGTIVQFERFAFCRKISNNEWWFTQK